MNKKLIILLVIVIALGLMYYLLNTRPWSTVKGELKEFAIKDTAKIIRIFIAEKTGKKVLLERKENNLWLVNAKYIADANKVNLLLNTMYDLAVMRPLAETEYNTTIAQLASNGTKVELYENDDALRTFYVGSATPDQTGTFMMLEGSSTPFVMHIPGFVGYLTPRFFTNEKAWKSRLVFNENPENIKSIKVTYPEMPNESFTIENGKLIDDAGKQIGVDVRAIKFYLASFNGLFFEGYDDYFSAEQTDSIYRTQAHCILTLTRTDNSQTTLKLHYKNIDLHTKQPYDENGKPFTHDPEKFYGFVNAEKQVVYIQQYNFGKVLVKLSDFKAR